ncbi:MAG: YhjD/YihY/BrkB family envelope integrity protein [Planctomycetota bacterium]
MNPPPSPPPIPLPERARQFFEATLWDADLAEMPPWRAFAWRRLRVISLAVKGFLENRGPLRASALTYTTLLALVPLLAFIFAVAKGFDARNKLETWILARAGQSTPEIHAVTQEIVRAVGKYLDETRTGALGTLALVFLIYSVIRTMGTIEDSFNDIWGVRKSRTLARKFSDYLSVLAVAPLLVLTALGLTTTLSSFRFVQYLYSLGHFSVALEFAAMLVPYAAVWVAFIFLYKFMPNTRVKFSAALAGGVVGGTLWQIFLLGYIHLQIGVSAYNKIYASFAAIPIFLVWLYMSWVIVLVGAEVAWAWQNAARWRFEHRFPAASVADRELAAVRMMAEVCGRFDTGETPPSTEEMALHLRLPLPLARDILDRLAAGHLLAPAAEPREGWLPARPPDRIRVAEVLATLRRSGEALPFREDAGLERLRPVLAQAEAGAADALRGITLGELARTFREAPPDVPTSEPPRTQDTRLA